jgi:hypothetical protein
MRIDFLWLSRPNNFKDNLHDFVKKIQNTAVIIFKILKQRRLRSIWATRVNPLDIYPNL